MRSDDLAKQKKTVMKNCIILGSGRSGTSMAAGVLRKAGYFMGTQLTLANETNPKGQFEDREINAINEEILATVLPARPGGVIGKAFFKSRPRFGQRWLARVPLSSVITCPLHLQEKMRQLVDHVPFCFKDPRFSYTLPAWRPLVKQVVYVCIFRNPGAVVTSILKQAKIVEHLRDFRVTPKQAFEVWECMYSHILRKHYRQGGSWLFLHYEQFLEGSAYSRLKGALGVNVDAAFVDSRLNRSEPLKEIPRRVLEIYKELCGLASYSSPDQVERAKSTR